MLEHPNIMPIFDMGVYEDDQPYFVMKLIREDSLADILRELLKMNPLYVKRYTLPALLEIFVKVCDAVSYAHSKGVLHLDLKPENIKVGNYGEVLVCDWGLAKVIGSTTDTTVTEDKSVESLSQLTRHTVSGVIKGTPGFMAPEQISKGFGDKTEQTDIYSLGAILYSILTLRLHVTGESADDLITKTLSDTIILPSRRTPSRPIPEGVEAVAMKALSQQQPKRYEAVQDIITDINKYLMGFATEAEGASFTRLLLLLFKRNSALSISFIISVSTIVAILTFFLIKIEHERTIAEEANQKYQRVYEASLKVKEGYLREKSERHKVSLTLVMNLITQADNHFAKKEYESAFEKVDIAYGITPNYRCIKLKVIREFGQHNFQAALELMEKLYIKERIDFRELSRKYNGELINEHLPIDSLINLCTELFEGGHRDIALYLVTVAPKHGYSTDDLLKMALNMLSKENRGADLESDEMILANGSCELSLAGNSALTNIDFLTCLPLVALDLERTKVKDISPLKSTKLESLNLAETQVNALSGLASMPLKTIDLRGALVKDLSPLKLTPVEEIVLSFIDKGNINHFVDFPRLKHIIIPNRFYNVSLFSRLKPEIEIFLY